MAKKLTKVKQDAPSSLTMRLFDPGMSMLHRAGLGGLACTLRYIERAYEMGIYLDDEIPGGPWKDGITPWKINPLQVILDFGEPENAGEFLHRLFKIAFQIKDGLIYLPAQYLYEPSISTRFYHHHGLILSFLQHGKVRDLLKQETQDTFSVDDVQINVTFKKCNSYKHQDGWENFIDKKGCLHSKNIEIIGPINPGAVVRHVAFNTKTRIEESVSNVLPLYFSIVGCITIPINKVSGVLIVPEVNNVVQFSSNRPYMTPASSKECRITNVGDAALQAQIRLKSKQLIEWNDIPACQAISFQSTPWASQQKSRVRTISIPPGEEERLHQFEIALAEFPPRTKSKKKEKGKGKKKKVFQQEISFWVDNIIRPLIAENLACKKQFYEGFTSLMNEKSISKQVRYEKKGLKAMIDKIKMEERERILINVIHESIKKIYKDILTKTQQGQNSEISPATKNRWENQYEQWRLSFSGSKTPDQIRNALCILFSRAKINKELQEKWPEVLAFFMKRDEWKLLRDLSLLALASYSKDGAKQLDDNELEENSNNTN